MERKKQKTPKVRKTKYFAPISDHYTWIRQGIV